MKEKAIRALYDENTITVYQAYNTLIAQTAMHAQTFVSPPFKKERMTWIKPSFLWMMYRSAWATKQDQNCILAITLKREGFEWALQYACLSHFDNAIHSSYQTWKLRLQNSPVRIQWDPEKNIFLQPLPYRSIQIGLSGIAIERYISDWIIHIDNITDQCRIIHKFLEDGKISKANDLLPVEKLYPVPEHIASNINSN